MQFEGTENLGLTSIANYINLFIVNANFPSTGVILIQVLTGFVGSLTAGVIIALISERRFNQAIRMSETNITSALDRIDKTVLNIAERTARLPALVPAVSSISNAIKRLAEMVDKLREGLEKTK